MILMLLWMRDFQENSLSEYYGAAGFFRIFPLSKPANKKSNAANEELVISQKYGREVQERKTIYRLRDCFKVCVNLKN